MWSRSRRAGRSLRAAALIVIYLLGFTGLLAGVAPPGAAAQVLSYPGWPSPAPAPTLSSTAAGATGVTWSLRIGDLPWSRITITDTAGAAFPTSAGSYTLTAADGQTLAVTGVTAVAGGVQLTTACSSPGAALVCLQGLLAPPAFGASSALEVTVAGVRNPTNSVGSVNPFVVDAVTVNAAMSAGPNAGATYTFPLRPVEIQPPFPGWPQQGTAADLSTTAAGATGVTWSVLLPPQQWQNIVLTDSGGAVWPTTNTAYSTSVTLLYSTSVTPTETIPYTPLTVTHVTPLPGGVGLTLACNTSPPPSVSLLDYNYCEQDKPPSTELVKPSSVSEVTLSVSGVINPPLTPQGALPTPDDVLLTASDPNLSTTPEGQGPFDFPLQPVTLTAPPSFSPPSTGLSVGAVSASPATAGSPSTWTIPFTAPAQGNGTSGDVAFLSDQAGAAFPATASSYQLSTDGLTSVPQSVYAVSGGAALTFAAGTFPLLPGSQSTLSVSLTNPVAGSGSDRVSLELPGYGPGQSPAFSFSAPAASFSLSTALPGATSTLSVVWHTTTSSLVGGIAAGLGTQSFILGDTLGLLPGSAADYSVSTAPAACAFGATSFQPVVTGYTASSSAGTPSSVNLAPQPGALACYIPAGATVTVTVTGVSNPASIPPGTTEQFSVSFPSSDHLSGLAAQTQQSPALPLTPAGVTVTPTSTVSGAAGATWTVGFTNAAAALQGGDTITLADVLGAGFPQAAADYTLSAGGAPIAPSNAANPAPGQVVLTLPAGASIPSGAAVSVQALDVTNPAAAGQADTLTVATSRAGTSAPSAPFLFAAHGGQFNLTPVFVAAPLTAGVQATWTVAFTPTAALAAGSALTLSGPQGTGFPAPAADYTFLDTTAGGGASALTAAPTVSSSGATVALALPRAVSPGDNLVLSVAGVTNPSAGTDPGSDFSVTTTANPAAVAAAAGLTFTEPVAAPTITMPALAPSPLVNAGTGQDVALTATGIGPCSSTGETIPSVPDTSTTSDSKGYPDNPTAGVGNGSIVTVPTCQLTESLSSQGSTYVSASPTITLPLSCSFSYKSPSGFGVATHPNTMWALHDLLTNQYNSTQPGQGIAGVGVDDIPNSVGASDVAGETQDGGALWGEIVNNDYGAGLAAISDSDYLPVSQTPNQPDAQVQNFYDGNYLHCAFQLEDASGNPVGPLVQLDTNPADNQNGKTNTASRTLTATLPSINGSYHLAYDIWTGQTTQVQAGDHGQFVTPDGPQGCSWQENDQQAVYSLQNSSQVDLSTGGTFPTNYSQWTFASWSNVGLGPLAEPSIQCQQNPPFQQGGSAGAVQGNNAYMAAMRNQQGDPNQQQNDNLNLYPGEASNALTTGWGVGNGFANTLGDVFCQAGAVSHAECPQPLAGTGSENTPERLVGAVPLNISVAPLTMVQLDVMPYKILYQPPGDRSQASFTTADTTTSGTEVSFGQSNSGMTATDNGTATQSSSTQNNENQILSFLGATNQTTTTSNSSWDSTTSATTAAANAQTNSVKWTDTFTESWQTAPNPQQLKNPAVPPWYYDEFALSVHPQIGIWDMASTQGVGGGTSSGGTSISSVTVSGAPPNLTMTINGSGFGPAPSGVPCTGSGGCDVPNFLFGDNTEGWAAGGGTTGVTLRYASWSNSQIVIDGFGPVYGNTFVVNPGDGITLRVTDSATGQQASWSGTLTTGGCGVGQPSCGSLAVQPQTQYQLINTDSTEVDVTAQQLLQCEQGTPLQLPVSAPGVTLPPQECGSLLNLDPFAAAATQSANPGAALGSLATDIKTIDRLGSPGLGTNGSTGVSLTSQEAQTTSTTASTSFTSSITDVLANSTAIQTTTGFNPSTVSTLLGIAGVLLLGDGGSGGPGAQAYSVLPALAPTELATAPGPLAGGAGPDPASLALLQPQNRAALHPATGTSGAAGTGVQVLPLLAPRERGDVIQLPPPTPAEIEQVLPGVQPSTLQALENPQTPAARAIDGEITADIQGQMAAIQSQMNQVRGAAVAYQAKSDQALANKQTSLSHQYFDQMENSLQQYNQLQAQYDQLASQLPAPEVSAANVDTSTLSAESGTASTDVSRLSGAVSTLQSDLANPSVTPAQLTTAENVETTDFNTFSSDSQTEVNTVTADESSLSGVEKTYQQPTPVDAEGLTAAEGQTQTAAAAEEAGGVGTAAAGILLLAGFAVGQLANTLSSSPTTTTSTTNTSAMTVSVSYQQSTMTSTDIANAAGATLQDDTNPVETTIWLDSRFDTLMFQTPMPTVSGIGPSSGPTSGGTPVSVSGTGFWSGPVGVDLCVTGGGACTPATDVQAVSDTNLTAVTPPLGAGTFDLRVQGQAGLSAVVPADQFTFAGSGQAGPAVVGSVSPSSGPTGGGTPVTLTGSGFTRVSQVWFGAVSPAQNAAVPQPVGGALPLYAQASSYRVVSDQEIVACAPAVAGAETVYVAVYGPAGWSSATPADQFTYIPGSAVSGGDCGQAGSPPVITSVSPGVGPATGGTPVTIQGSGFADSQLLAGCTGTACPAGDTATLLVPPVVEFCAAGGSPCSQATDVQLLSDTEISAVAPPGQGTVDVQVDSPAGFSAPSDSDLFTYGSPPATGPGGTPASIVVGADPGSAAAGIGSVTVLATVLDTNDQPVAGTQVQFGTDLGALSAAQATTDSQGVASVTLTAPSAGTATVTAQVTGGTPLLNQTQVAFLPVPVVTGLSESRGAAGDTLTITGQGFTGATAVYFGTTLAANLQTNAGGSLSVTVPPGTGSVDVHVANPTVLSPAVTADLFAYPTAGATATSSSVTVTGVSPDSGPASGGPSAVTVYGTGFVAGATVDFGTAPASGVDVISATELTAVPPAGSGTVDVTVTVGGLTSAASVGDQYHYATLTVASVVPATGPAAGGGGPVSIFGTGFASGATVSFGGAAATDVGVTSSTEIQAVPPAGSGTVDVAVTVNGQTATLSGGFTYVAAAPTVGGVSPASGPAAGGGSPVTVYGSGFVTGATVDFGPGDPGSSVTVLSATELTVVPPAGTGTVDVTVSEGGLSSAASAGDRYSYVALAVTGVSPGSGPASGGGSPVAIYGTGFAQGASVSFGGAAAGDVVVVSPDEITAVAPPGSGTVPVVLGVGGASSSPSSPAAQYTYLALPAVSGLSPASGTVLTAVTVRGSGFNPGAAVDFGPNPANSVRFVSDSQLVATAPPGTGTVDVTVRTGVGASATNPDDEYTYDGTPSAPTDVVATAGSGQATVSWLAPASDGGSAIQSYTVTSIPNGFTAFVSTVAGSVYGTGDRATVTGLTDGVPYSFTVTAANAAGSGPASVPSNTVTPELYPGGSAPGAPHDVVAAAGDGQATVSWAPPGSNGPPAVSQYLVVSSPGGFEATVPGAVYGGGDQATVQGLADGTAYSFTVTAANAVGAGPASAVSNAVTPEPYPAGSTAPGAPTDVVASRIGDGAVAVSWQAPGSTGGSAILSYTVTSSPSGVTVTLPVAPGGTATAFAATVTGLVDGTDYSFTVTATNAVGTGPSSVASNGATPEPYTVGAQAPGAPSGVVATAGSGQATVSWSAPSSDGGSAVTGYTVTSSGGQTASVQGAAAAGPTASATVTGLSNGVSYTFTVTATNAVGTGPASAPSNPIVAGAPSGPPAVSALSPASGPAGTLVLVTGTGFDDTASVLFGALTSPGVEVLSPTQLVAAAPPGGSGTAAVQVRTSGGLSPVTAGARFTYSAAPASPLSITRPLLPGWNALSIPFPLAQTSLAQILSDGGASLIVAYTYQDGRWQLLPLGGPDGGGLARDANPGNGVLQQPMAGLFLDIASTGSPVTATFTEASAAGAGSSAPPGAPSGQPPQAPVSIALSQGWNLVGPAAQAGAQSDANFVAGQPQSALPVLADPSEGDAVVSAPGQATSGAVVDTFGYWLFAERSGTVLAGEIP